MHANQNTWRLLLLRLWPSRLKTTACFKLCKYGTRHDRSNQVSSKICLILSAYYIYDANVTNVYILIHVVFWVGYTFEIWFIHHIFQHYFAFAIRHRCRETIWNLKEKLIHCSKQVSPQKFKINFVQQNT